MRLISLTLSQTGGGKGVRPSALTTVKIGLLIKWLSTSLAPVNLLKRCPMVYLPHPAKPIRRIIVLSKLIFTSDLLKAEDVKSARALHCGVQIFCALIISALEGSKSWTAVFVKKVNPL